MKSDEVHAYWNSRASLGLSAGTKDIILKQLEIEKISKYVGEGMRVLDAGCGNGITALEIAKKFDVHVVGFDFAGEMIEEAKLTAASSKLKGSAVFHVANIKNIPKILGSFDLIYTERALINLASWHEQKQAIADISNFLVDGGIYVMCESTRDGLERINRIREKIDLSRVEPPWHNRYLFDSEVEQCTIPGLKLESVEHFSSTYYFLSRVVNAWMAVQEGSEPDYNAPVNQLALSLPPIGDLGQTQIWLWRKTGSTAPNTKNKES